MSHPHRLVTLLRLFRLPPNASVSDLKGAYHREAKRLHPDRCASGKQDVAARDFAELQSSFEEATALLRNLDQVSSPIQRPSTSSRAHGGDWYHAYASFGNASGLHPGTQAVPAMGLPAQFVYSATAVVSLSIAGAWFFWQERADKVSERKHIAAKSQPAVPHSSQVGALSPTGASHQTGRGVGTAEFRDASAYYGTLSQFRRTKSRKPKSGRVEPQLRDGVALTPAHVAAEDDQVWFLERCGASKSCRGILDSSDRRGDTPLHRCASGGHELTCRTLLRIGADAGVENKWHLRPEDLAAHQGHLMTAALLQATRTRTALGDPAVKAMALEIGRHPDGVGLLSNLPDGMFYNGPYHSECLRNAVNYAAGVPIVGDLDLSGANSSELQDVAVSGADWKREFALNRVRLHLKGSNFELEGITIAPGTMGPRGAGWGLHDDGTEVQGLLMFEPAGSVTPDAPGHWMAIRPWPSSKISTGADATAFFRLDPVRGVYWLTEAELAELTLRYPAWRLVKQRSGGMFSN